MNQNIHANVRYVRERAELLRQTRAFFDCRGFCEVQPPCLSRDCVVDAYLDPITVPSAELGVAAETLPERYFLQTSPESAMKRMLAAGAPSIYSVGPVFRRGESGGLHNPEFTMLEWYEIGGDADSAIDLTGRLVASVLGSGGYDRVRYRDAFRSRLGVDPIDDSVASLRDVASERTADEQLVASFGEDRNGLLDLLLSQCLQPDFGRVRPLILTDYPMQQAALAKQSRNDPACAARFECFAGGVELANGYDELLDAEELIRRAKSSNRRRGQTGREHLQTDTTLFRAMQDGLPPCSGVALGLDRLLMLRVGERTLNAVLPMTIDIA
jgi:lysyl-tRNA synthetase class 2